MRRLCTGLYHDVAQISFGCCVRPDQTYCIRRDGYRLVSWGARTIRRSILHVLLCPPIRLTGLTYFLMPFYLNGVGVQAELLAGMPLYRDHEVAD